MKIKFTDNLKKFILSLLIILCLCHIISVTYAADLKNGEPKKINVFVLAGQSNMQGHGQPIQLQKLLCAVDEYVIQNDTCYSGEDPFKRIFETITDYYRPGKGETPVYNYDETLAKNEASAILQYYKEGVFRKDLLDKLHKVKIVTINYSRNTNGTLSTPSIIKGTLEPRYGANSNRYGPELLIGHTLARSKKISGDILLIKVVQGGSDLYEQWRSPTMNKRLPATTKESLYPKLVEWVKTITENIPEYFPEYTDNTLDTKIKGFFWFQGFNDMFNVNFVSAYRDNLIDFLSDLRCAFSSPKLPISIATDANNGTNGLMIQQAQQDVEKILLEIKYTETRDLSAFYHFDSASHIMIGERMANNMLQLL